MVQEQIPITLVSSVDAALPADNLITTQRPTRKLQDLQTNVIQHNPRVGRGAIAIKTVSR